MNNMEVLNVLENNYKKNVKKLKEYAYHYYELDDPKVSDSEYDILARQCREFEKNYPKLRDKNSPNLRVGLPVSTSFSKANHINNMFSQEDIFDIDELFAWIAKRKSKIDKEDIDLDMAMIIQPKLDGCSLNLIYENGLLSKAITRGDGQIGEDVTKNAKNIFNIPLEISIKSYIEIRGEVIIFKSDFEKINEDRKKEKLRPFANQRNLAAGSLRQLDFSVTRKRKLKFIPWDIGYNELDDKLNYLEKLNLVFKEFKSNIDMLENNLKCEYNKVFNWRRPNIKLIEDVYNIFIDRANSTGVPMDGVVIKLVNNKVQKLLGANNKFEKWSCAFKFPPTEVETMVKEVIWTVGEKGAVVPVAILEPVELLGTKVSKAYLYNYKEIKRLGLKINNKVILTKAGDIIPKILKVIKDFNYEVLMPSGNYVRPHIDIFIPKECPVCNSVLEVGNTLMCTNKLCEAKKGK